MPLLTCRVVISEVGESLFPWIIGDNLIHQYPLEDWIEQTPPPPDIYTNCYHAVPTTDYSLCSKSVTKMQLMFTATCTNGLLIVLCSLVN